MILPLSGDQVVALMESGSPLLRACVAVLADCGLRASELCGLSVDDVRDNFLVVREAKACETTLPGAREATVLLP